MTRIVTPSKLSLVEPYQLGGKAQLLVDIVGTGIMKFEELYETLDADKIDDLIASGQEENLHLDFKLVNSAQMNRDDRRNLAKALSGFSNSDGGIVVWGIDARANEAGINCACGKRVVAPLSLFITKLNEFTGSHVNPSVDGVLHRRIAVEGDSGFGVTLVPRSDSGPHMAKGGEDRYYKRSGDSFRRMEHFDIEDMFGRRSRPRLNLMYRIMRGPGRSGEVLDFKVILSIYNDGRGTARAPYLSIEVEGPCEIDRFGIDGNGTEGLNRLVSPAGSKRIRYGGMGDICIHPGTTHDVLALRGKFDPDALGFGDLNIDYEITAEGLKLVSKKLLIPVNPLIAEVRRAWA